jgi:hypothetical protein
MSYSCIRGDITQPMPLTLEVDGVATIIDDDATVQLRWTKPDGTTTLVDLAEVDFSVGEVQRIWVAGDTDDIGAHSGQIVVTVDGETDTFPNDGSLIWWWVYPQAGDDC